MDFGHQPRSENGDSLMKMGRILTLFAMVLGTVMLFMKADVSTVTNFNLAGDHAEPFVKVVEDQTAEPSEAVKRSIRTELPADQRYPSDQR